MHLHITFPPGLMKTLFVSVMSGSSGKLQHVFCNMAVISAPVLMLSGMLVPFTYKWMSEWSSVGVVFPIKVLRNHTSPSSSSSFSCVTALTNLVLQTTSTCRFLLHDVFLLQEKRQGSCVLPQLEQLQSCSGLDGPLKYLLFICLFFLCVLLNGWQCFSFWLTVVLTSTFCYFPQLKLASNTYCFLQC